MLPIFYRSTIYPRGIWDMWPIVCKHVDHVTSFYPVENDVEINHMLTLFSNVYGKFHPNVGFPYTKRDQRATRCVWVCVCICVCVCVCVCVIYIGI